MKRKKNYDQEPVKTTTIYKDSIVGGHNNALIYMHDQGRFSGKSDSNSDDQSYHTQIDDATSQATPDVRRPLLNSANNNTTSNSSPSNSYDDKLDYEATPNSIDTHLNADDVRPSDTLPLISPPVSPSDESTATSTSQLSLSLQAPHGAPFIVDRVDISERFYRLQQYVFDFVKTNNLTVESDSHLILSLSSILLLQNNNRLNHAMIPFFGDKLYSKIRKHNLGEWNMTLKFPGNLLLESIIIAQNLYDETTDRINACASLLLLANTIDDPIDKRLLVSASQLLQLLPVDATNIEISETTFITRYILPALQPLFDNQERNIHFEFSSTDPADNHKRSPGFNGCPDCIITIFQHQTDDGAMAGNHYLVNWDLLRLAVFGKNAIDENKLSGNLAIHVVGEFCDGPYITFYLIKLHADGLYIMTELARLQCPMSVMEVPAYLTNFSRLKNVIHTFENLCKPVLSEITSKWKDCKL